MSEGAQHIGLTQQEAARRLAAFGGNILPSAPPRSLLRLFLDQFMHPFIYVLLVACALVAVLGEYTDAYVIGGVILLNAIIGVIQEGKAQNTLRALSQYVQSTATVIRDGREVVIPDTEVVLGDCIIIREGDRIPADATVFFERGFLADQASLTGESEPIPKTTDGTEESRIFRGTQCVGGFAKAEVTAIGIETRIGAIAQGLSTIDTDVPLKRAIKDMSRTILYITGIFLVFIAVVGWASYEPAVLLSMIVAVAVSVIPESLPVVVTLILAGGVHRMSKRNALVKRLQAVEALGQTDIIAVDKTGTVTRNEMMVIALRAGTEMFSVTGDGYAPTGSFTHEGKDISPVAHKGLVHMLTWSSLIADAHMVFDEPTKTWRRAGGDPTDAALVVVGTKAGFIRSELEQEYVLIDEVPFSTKTKTHSATYTRDGVKQTVLVGSPEVILESCTVYTVSGAAVPLTAAARAQEHEAVTAMMRQGLRVIAVASNSGDGLTLAGFFGIQDAIRQGVLESVTEVQQAGVRVIMITGDHAHTAMAIAGAVGIWKEGQDVLSGYEIETLSDEDILPKIETVNVYARVSPEQKLRIIELLKKAGHTVAMTGDGVNDALSLVKADLGIAMGRIGTQVAQEAADMILLDDRFGSIVAAIEEGRRMHTLITRTVAYLLSTNFSELLVIAGAVSFGLPLPFTPTQIIWINLVTDSFLVAALAVDRHRSDTMRLSPAYFSGPIVSRASFGRMAVMAATMSLVTLVTYVLFLPSGQELAATIAFFTLLAFQWFNVFNVRGYSVPKWSLFAALAAVLLLQTLAMTIPALTHALSIIPLTASAVASTILLGASILVTDGLWRWYTKGVRTF